MFSVVVIVIQQVLCNNEENCKSNRVPPFLGERELIYISIIIYLSWSLRALLGCKWETLSGGTRTSKTEGTRALDRRQLGPQ